MANQFTEDRLVDSNRKTVIKLTGRFDGTGQISNTVLVDTSTLAFAMNANNLIMVSNTHPKGAYRVSVSRVWGDVNIPNGYLTLSYEGDANTPFVFLSGQINDLNFEEAKAAGIDSNEANATGNILISTMGAAANNSYTLFLELNKNAQDFSQGQHSDPAAFNYGEFGIV